VHPAFSIIAFTVLSGFGYGLAAILGLGLLDPSATATEVAHLLALGCIAGGLLSSTLHLGNPQRAWRALSQWRSSWLSREGVLAIATFAPLACSAWASVVDGRYLLAPGLLGAAGCAATVYCTSMIYSSLRSVQAWHTPLTSACYLAFAIAAGLLGATAVAAMSGQGVGWVIAALAGLGGAVALKYLWRQRMMTTTPLSTPESATGLGFIGKVRQFEAPHATDNYLTREMGFVIARKHARKLWMVSLVLFGVVPAMLIALAALAWGTTWAAVLSGTAVVVHIAGMLVERWLFFAEAKHAVMNFYGRGPA